MLKSPYKFLLVLYTLVFCTLVVISRAEDVDQSKIDTSNSTTKVVELEDSGSENIKNITSEKLDIDKEGVLLKNGSRGGRGILDTVKTLIQTAQTVNKLFGNSNSNSNSNNHGNQNQIQNVYPGNAQNNYYQNQNQHQNQNFNSNPNVNYQGVPSGSNYYNPANPGTFTDYYGQTHQVPAPGSAPLYQQQQQQQQIPSSIYPQNPSASASQLHPNYQSFPVSSSLSVQNHNNNNPHNHQQYPGSVSNVPLNGPVDTGVYNNIPVNKQGQGFPVNSPVGSVGSPGGALGVLDALGNGGNLLSSLGELGVVEDLSELLSFGNVEKVLTNVNKFDSLQCIPRLVCQTIARRQQEAADKEREAARTSTTTTTRRPKNKGRKNKNKDNANANDDKNGGEGGRSARLIPGFPRFKIQGMDTALEQVVKFLDLMQLKDWSLYPYLQGAYHGNQVRTWDECAEKFSTCPFSEDQLLYYFNNYKGGLFQSFRSDLQSTLASSSSSS